MKVKNVVTGESIDVSDERAQALTNAGSHVPDGDLPDPVERPAEQMSEADLRHEQAKSDSATPQEKKQAATELADVDEKTRPQGSFAQLHETVIPTVHVPDDTATDRMRADQEEAAASLSGEGDAAAAQPAPAKTTATKKAEDSGK